jgi:branched-chain amino acid transport system ATP-binding protein
MVLVEAADLTKEFGGLVAVDTVSFKVFNGQIKALIGPNGAGKTTIFNLLSGFEKPTRGRIKFKNKSIVGLKPHQIAALGLGRTFQNTQLFEELTVLENVKIGCHLKGKTEIWRAMLHFPPIKDEEDQIEERADRYLGLVGLREKKELLAGDLPQGERHLLEIARALAAEPELLLLDEPAAGLNNYETERLAETIYKIRDSGVTIFLVEHDMGLVMEVSDEVIVLNYGRKIAEGPPLLIQKNEEVIQAYLGGEISA